MLAGVEPGDATPSGVRGLLLEQQLLYVGPLYWNESAMDKIRASGGLARIGRSRCGAAGARAGSRGADFRPDAERRRVQGSRGGNSGLAAGPAAGAGGRA